MPTPIVMPKLGMSMEEGTVVAWTVAPGARVEKGTTVLVIESEKAEVEIEATAAGHFRHVYVAEGETVPCGTVLAALTDAPDEPFDAAAFHAAHRPDTIVSPTSRGAAPPRASAPSAASPGRASGAPVTPAARKRAKELGFDPASVAGTGPGGRVTREDVDAFAVARAGRVEVAPGVALEVPTDGPEDGPRVLLLPGFGTDVSAFARQTPLLAASRRVLGVNPRGVGLSDAPDAKRCDVSEMARDAARVAGGPVDVVGASLGAAVAIELALSSPEAVRSLTLVTPFAVASPRLLAVVDSWCELAASVTPDVLARALLPWLFSPTFLADARAASRTARGLAATAARIPPATLAATAAGLRAWSGTREADLAKIAAPTRVIAAGGDLLTPSAASVADAIPGATCTIVPDAGHAVALEAPDAVGRALSEHLGLPARRAAPGVSPDVRRS